MAISTQFHDPYGYDRQMHSQREEYMRQMQNEQARHMGMLGQQFGLGNQGIQSAPVSQPEPNKVLLLLE